MDRFGLITLRLRAGLKQWELAHLLGISQTTLCDLQRGRRPITPEIADKIKKVIGWSRRNDGSQEKKEDARGS